MPYERPTLSELRQEVASDINAALPGVDALLRYSNVGIIGEVQAALANGHYGYLDWIARQAVPFTATGEHLEGWAALKGVTRKGARRAFGSVAFAAVDGSVVANGAQMMRRDGVAYEATADATAVAGVVTVPVRSAGMGSGGNVGAGTAFTLSSGAVGVSASGTAAGPITGGADIERDDQLRGRMLAAYAAPAQGGSIADYARWAEAVPGVSRAWIEIAPEGPGTVGVLFMMAVTDANPSGFPVGTDGVSQYDERDTAAAGDQLLVADTIFPLQSATAQVYVIAPIANHLGLTLAGIPGASDETKAAIAGAVVQALFLNNAPGGLTNVSLIEAAIASVPAAAGFVITNITASAGSVTPGSAGNITSAPRALARLGSVTYV